MKGDEKMKDISISILALGSFKGIGPVKVQAALKELSEMQDKLDYIHLTNIKEKKVKQLVDNEIINKLSWLEAKEKAKEQLITAEEQGISVINFKEKQYPQNFLRQKKYPLIIYVKGNISILNNEKTVAIIGTRKPTNLGGAFNQRISEYFYNEGYTVVSGLAKGHDTYAHQVGVRTTGKTVAILAHGLDQDIYPKENKQLANDILEANGTWLSTYPLGQKMLPQYLAARDEWQTSMSDGVIAVETGVNGGTNHALNHALKQGKPVGMLDHNKCMEYVVNDKFKNEDYEKRKKEYIKLIKELQRYEQIYGNYERIEKKEVTPLYKKEEYPAFNRALQKYHNKEYSRETKDNEKNSKSKQPQSRTEQVGFEF